MGRLIRRLRSGESPIPGLVLLLVLVGAVFRQHLFSGYTFPWDFTATSHMAVFIANTAGSGNYTEWIPFLGGGFPLPVNALSMLYFPVWWMLGLLGIPSTVAVQTAIQVAHVWLGAAGVLALARSRGVSWRWAVLAAVAFVFYGGFYGSGSHENIFRGHAYAPWLLWSLTLPADRAYPRRLLALPVFVWILATGSYSGQALGFLQVGAIYFAIELWRSRKERDLRKLLLYAVPPAAGAMAVLLAVYLPSIVANARGELYRPFPPDAAERAIWSLKPVDLFGLYLDPFAWQGVDGTIRAWAVGAVVLIGVACVNRRILTEHLSLVAAGALATVASMLPSWVPAGEVLVKVPFMFPSRLVASDYKAVAAVALVILSALGWGRVAAEGRARYAAGVAGVLLLAGLFLAPRYTDIPPTATPWLVAGLVAAATALAYAPRRLGVVVPVLVGLLLVVDGFRMVSEMELRPGFSPWSTAPAGFPTLELHDERARTLDAILADPPDRRPARLPDTVSPSTGGSGLDATAYLADAYHLGDYSGAVTMERWRTSRSPRLTEAMLRPWTAWVVPCREVDCADGSPALSDRILAGESASVATTSYGLDEIRYRVRLQERSLFVENEFAARGWSADRDAIRKVKVGGALRGWVLPAGDYSFTARYVQPERGSQIGLAAFALLTMLAGMAAYRRAARPALVPVQTPAEEPVARQPVPSAGRGL
ncbi:MAG TPA: hypothetical protein VHJ78_05590 [Actinomycetota bacterium]|nr:hypothetical protein [Actinomycetota bacterium]